MITKFNQYNLITETPDKLYDGKDLLYITDDQAIPFFIKPNKNHTNVENLFVGDIGSSHNDLLNKEKYWDKEVFYPGRMWIKNKIITFWTFPSEELFKEIINKFELTLNIKMFNNGWRIEVLITDNEINKGKYDSSTGEYSLSGASDDCETVFVPLEEYAGSDNVPEEIRIIHLMNWKEKELAKKVGKLHFGSFGSKLTAWDQPHNIKWRRAMYQENKRN